MNRIIFWAILTAFVFGCFVTCIINLIYISVKCLKCGKRSKRIWVKDYQSSNMWWIIALAIIHGLKAAVTGFYGLKYCDFTESISRKIQILCSVLIFFSFILVFFLRTRAYITETGIITAMAFLPVSGIKYSVKTEYDVHIINLYTQKQMPSYTFCTKKQTAMAMLENFYKEADGTAAKIKIKSHTTPYLLTILCTSLISVGGLFSWYSITKPVIFVGDKIVKTDSEYALFDRMGFRNIMFGNEFNTEITEKGDEMYYYIDETENLTSKDMAALKKMPNLKYLSVYRNNITDLSDIGSLTQLEGLACGAGINNDIPEDYLPLKNLINLKYFFGAGLENFHDLTIFENNNELIYFELTCADIQTGLDVICEKEKLLYMELFRCTAEDFSPIGKCADLKSLGLSSTNVTDLSFLKNLKELEYLDIRNIKAEDYSVLLELPNLNTLHAKNTDIPNYIVNKLAANGVDIKR